MECESLFQIDIPASVQIITCSAFLKCRSFTEVTFLVNSQVHKVSGFQECDSLSRIDIPASVEIITSSGFYKCFSLKEVRFMRESCLKTMKGFQNASHFLELIFQSRFDRSGNERSGNAQDL
jgi:hypothetical protein